MLIMHSSTELTSDRFQDYGFTATDAYLLVSTCPDFRINVYQMCNLAKLSYVAGAEIPKKYLQG